MVEYMKKYIMLLLLLSVSCSQLIKPDSKREYENIYKHLTNAESLENPVQKEKLLTRAYGIIQQSALTKREKTDSRLLALLSYYYFLKGNYKDAEVNIGSAQPLSADDPFMAVLQARIILATQGKSGVQAALGLLSPYEKYDNPMMYIATGDAYFIKGDYTTARDNYKKALLLDKELQVVAANRLEVISRISTLTIDVSKVSDFILQPAMTRDKVAYLMYEIFEIQKYISAVKPLDANFIDIEKSHYSAAIINLRKKGFFSYIDGGSFEPFMIVSRGEMAKIVEDFLVLSKNNEGLRKKYAHESPSFFNDSKPDNPYYNALRLACDVGVMSVSLSQDAYPDEAVTGLQAIMIIQKLVK